MRTRAITTTALLAAILTGCGTTTPAPNSVSAAQKLADLDGDVRPVDQYQAALDAWAARCNEGPEQLAGYAYATVEDLRKNGVTDETEYSALVHLKDAVPAGMKMKCEDVAASYLVLRESGQS